MTLNKRGKILRSDAREMVYSIIQYFEEEKRSKRYHPYKHSNLRAALATGLSASTISKIRKEGQLATQSQSKIKTPSKGNRGRNNTRVPLTIAALCNVREIIANLYDARELPTTQKIVTMAKKDFNLNLTPSTLRRILKNKFGFKYKKLSKNRRLLIESNNIKAKRATYLRRIRNNDNLQASRKPVIYVGESCIDVIANKIKGKKSIVQRYFFIYAVSETGCLKNTAFIIKGGDDKDEVDSIEFLNYVEEKLIPNLPDLSILVVNNSPCHNAVLNKAPSSSALKDDIKKWMVDNYIPFEEEWTKAEMIVHLQTNIPEKEYALDNLLSKYGHEVLRLPPYNFDLNPIDRIWNTLKEKITLLFKQVDDDNLEHLARKVSSLVTVEDCKKQIDNVKKAERKYWLREVIREDKFEDFVKSLGMNSDDDTDYLSEGASSSDETVECIESTENEPSK